MLRTILVLCLAVACQSVQAATIVTAARVWPAADYTRITLESAKPITHKMVMLKNPDRLVLDLDDVELGPNLKSLTDKILSGDPYIKQVRAAYFKPGVVRLAIDLKGEIKPEIFALQPAGEYKHRLVVDVYPAQDPLLALLAQKDKTTQAAAPAATAPAIAKPAIPDLQMATVITPPAGEPSKPEAAKVEPAKPLDTALPNAEAVASENKPAETKLPEAKPQDSKPAQLATIDSRIATDPKVSEPKLPEVKPAEIKPPVIEQIIKNKEDPRLITIAIDAGHGGEDPGARGANGSHEKDITLSVAKKLKAAIDAEPNMRGILTRDGDYFIPLHGRVIKARKMQADLFVSVHADAFVRPDARGSSVFALSERGATSASARYLAKKENESDLIGGVSLDDKDPYLAKTLLDLSQTATINDSLKLGKHVLSHIGEVNTLHKRSVEQAGFAVLKSPDIPSILVETAFISNPEEERKLNDDGYQDKLAQSILSGIKKYFASNPALSKTRIARD